MDLMQTISAVIIARNEEDNIGRCLDSVNWVNEIVVVDTGSVDKTIEIARVAGAVVYEIEWQGFGHAKAYGVDKATCDWILSVDADEEISIILAAEIRDAVKSGNRFSGYYIPRKTNFLGRWIEHSRWYPDYVLRLFRKDKGTFSKSLVHEKTLVEGPTARLRNPILHYSYPDVSTYLEKFERYTSLGAEELHRNGRRFYPSDLLVKPIAAFCRHYVFGAGFLDGVEGFLIAAFSAFGVMTKYAKLRSLEKAAKDDQSPSH